MTQADVDAGSIVNTGTLAGLDPDNLAVSQTAGATVTATRTATLGLTKTASPNTDVVAGDVVTYTFAGKNTGTTTLHNVGVTDPLPGLSAVSCAPVAPATLAPNATISCTATYTVTQANVDAGSFSDTATINGLDPADNPVSKTASRTVTALQTGALSLTKSASPNTDVVAGDVVAYTFAGKNTGTMTLHNVTVTTRSPASPPFRVRRWHRQRLHRNATLSCTATYTVTQANVDSGSYTNTATIAGLDPNNATVASNASRTVTADQTATLSLTKTASPDTGVVAGDVVTYAIDAQNTGTVTLHTVTVTDPTAVMGTCTPTLPVAALAPGGTISCTATHTVTQAEVDAGSFVNTATVTGLDPSDNAPSPRAPMPPSLRTRPTRSASPRRQRPPPASSPGDVVTYTLNGQNTGTTTLHNVDRDRPNGRDSPPSLARRPHPPRSPRAPRSAAPPPTRSPRTTSTPAPSSTPPPSPDSTPTTHRPPRPPVRPSPRIRRRASAS